MAAKFPTQSKRQLNDIAVRLAQLGDWEAAQRAFLDAIDSDRRNPDLYFNLSLVEEERGEISAAAIALTGALNLKPTYVKAARRLSRLLARYQLSEVGGLASNGLKAALLTKHIAHQPIVDVVLRQVFEVWPTLKAAAASVEEAVNPERAIAAPLVTVRTSDDLGNDLLLLALKIGIVRQPTVERVLTGVRASLLLECTAERFDDRRWSDLALALVVQGWNNDHAWAETPEETAAVAALTVDKMALLDGDREAARRFILRAMYRPLQLICGEALMSADACKLKPRSLRDTVEPRLVDEDRQATLARGLQRLKPLKDATSLKVAGQYEASPYPRWNSLHVSQPGALKQAMVRHFSGEQLAFMDQPFAVLIAGTGTGQQALQAATAYGPQAALTGLDLSGASLGYARAKADDYGIRNVRFVQGDILDIDALGHSFDIIECVGVLHHMADPWTGWRSLLGRLKPHGLMYIGLYSAVSRANLKALRGEPAYPGPGCSDSAARIFRRQLLDRADDAPGGSLKRSRDFFALHAFRDLALHESEQHMMVGQIEAFLAANGLEFRGFTLDPQIQAAFELAYPGSSYPGRLVDWAAFELANPTTFDAMYRFWVGRKGQP